MTDTAQDLAGMRILACAADGPRVRTGADATDLIGAAWGAEAKLVALPLARLDPACLDLKTALLGEIAQKFVNYSLRLALVGDISAAVANSRALHDFVYESNRGKHLWFVPDMTALKAKLEAA